MPWPLIAAAAGTAISGISSLIGGNSASKAAKRAKAQVEREQKENENWFNRAYNEDVTQRADAQRSLTLAEDAIRRRNNAVSGQQAVMGGTEESTNNTKSKNAQALANATSQIAAQGVTRRDNVEAQYRQTRHDLNQQLEGIENQRAQNVTQAVEGVGKAVGGFLQSYGTMGGDKENLKLRREV